MKHLFRELFLKYGFQIHEARLVYNEAPRNEPPPQEARKDKPLGVDPRSTGKFLKTGPLSTSLGEDVQVSEKGGKKVYKIEKPFVVDVTDIHEKVAKEKAALKEKVGNVLEGALAKMKKAMGSGQIAKDLLANASTDEQTAEAFRDIGGAPEAPKKPEAPRVAEVLPPPPEVARTERPPGEGS